MLFLSCLLRGWNSLSPVSVGVHLHSISVLWMLFRLYSKQSVTLWLGFNSFRVYVIRIKWKAIWSVPNSRMSEPTVRKRLGFQSASIRIGDWTNWIRFELNQSTDPIGDSAVKLNVFVSIRINPGGWRSFSKSFRGRMKWIRIQSVWAEWMDFIPIIFCFPN